MRISWTLRSGISEYLPSVAFTALAVCSVIVARRCGRGRRVSRSRIAASSRASSSSSSSTNASLGVQTTLKIQSVMDNVGFGEPPQVLPISRTWGQTAPRCTIPRAIRAFHAPHTLQLVVAGRTVLAVHRHTYESWIVRNRVYVTQVCVWGCGGGEVHTRMRAYPLLLVSRGTCTTWVTLAAGPVESKPRVWRA
jgi:hypothetical protein